MITVDQALALVEDEARPIRAADVSLIDALGRVLAEDVTADADEPPFDKALVDGFALRVADLREPAEFRVGETIVAGRTPSRALGAGEAAVVMTGAPVPEGTEAVVMHEETDSDGGRVRLRTAAMRPGQNLLPRGRVHRAGDVVLPAGGRLSAAALGLLASVGRTSVRVIPRPRIAIVSTGDELVDPGQVPGPGQIRNSNATMLEGLAMEHEAIPTAFPPCPDDADRLESVLREGLRHDVLVISGGVSAGQRDLVPGTLERLGVRRVFHKIRLKPGKPLWFGVGPGGVESPGTLVFGLPGNPVSSLVGFLLFVAPSLAALSGHGWHPLGLVDGELSDAFTHRGDRPTYHPARWRSHPGAGRPGQLEILRWAGSADLAAVALAQGFVVFPAGDRAYEVGETLPFLPLSRRPG